MLFRTGILMLALIGASLLPNAASASPAGTGLYMHYSYFYQNKDGMTAASFKPFLPRDDTILIGAMLELVTVVYGKHRIEELKPSLVARNGKNVISFRGIDYDYLFLLNKQDTGEVYGISMWREKRI